MPAAAGREQGLWRVKQKAGVPGCTPEQEQRPGPTAVGLQRARCLPATEDRSPREQGLSAGSFVVLAKQTQEVRLQDRVTRPLG